ncbi:Type I restriction-modification system, specificity subunit S [Minicystis rosea]|nr:Type I restriction-modification system, specificity subunit S [Minicystis rosea]
MTPWPQLPIGEVCRLVNGRAFKPCDWGSVGLPIVRIQNLNDQEKPFNFYDGPVDPRHVIDSGDVLLSWSGTPGTSFGCFVWDRGRAILNQHIFRVEVNESKILKTFFAYAVNERLDEMIGLAHGGVGLRHITKGKLESIKIGVPKISVQRRVVARIRDLLDRAAEIRQLRSASLSQANRLLSAALGDAEGALSLAGRVAVSDLILESRNGRSIKSSGEVGDGHVLTLSAVRQPLAALDEQKAIVLDDATAQQFAVRQGDIFVSRANTIELVGLSAFVEERPISRLIFPDLLIRLRPDERRIRRKYLTYALRFPGARRQIQERAVGSSQSMVKISGERLREVTVPLPDLTAQDRVVSWLDGVSKLTADLQARLTAEAGRDVHLPASILRKAFAGEL